MTHEQKVYLYALVELVLNDPALNARVQELLGTRGMEQLAGAFKALVIQRRGRGGE